MKRIFIYFISIAVIFVGCSKSDISFINDTEEINFPIQSEKYGKAVAKELNRMVKSLNEMGVDYSDADGSPEFKQRFYENLNQTMSPNLLRSTNDISQTQMSSRVFVEKVKNLTELQIRFIERIINECGESTSYDDFSKRLLAINKDISSSVPKIQQERLFNVTAVLYYGMHEIQNLEKQGQMLLTSYNTISFPRLKSGSEPGGGGLAAGCRKFLATVWTIAVGEPTPAGEIVASIATVIVGGIMLYEVITCKKEDYEDYYTIDDCIAAYTDCKENTWWYDCDMCLHRCRSSNKWRCPTS